MPQSWYTSALATIVSAFIAAPLCAQTTYHLHNEPSSTAGSSQLKTAGPDVARVVTRTASLKNQPPGDATIRTFDTQGGVPNRGGVIPSGSTVTFTMWMKKSSAAGTVFPRASLGLNVPVTTSLCQGTGTTALTTTLTAFTFSCTTASPIVMKTTDRLTVAAGYSMTVGPGSKNMKVRLDIEGKLDKSADSRVVAPDPVPPGITTVDPTSARINAGVTVTGASFGPTGESSSLTFNGTAATSTTWTNTQITASVPAGATSGPVVVTVGGAVSNAVAFTVIPAPSITSVTPSTGQVGSSTSIAGTNFGAPQGSSTVTFNGTVATPAAWSDTNIDVTVPTGATSGPVVVTVSGLASNGMAFTVEGESSLSLAITSPPDGAVVDAGQTLTVTVASPQNVQFALVGVMGEDPIGMSEVATSVPAQFSFPIPLNTTPRKYVLSAEATTASGQQGSASILIDVERPDLPLGIFTPLPQIVFEAQGEDAPIKIQGRFADDAVLDVTESSKVVYSSSDPAIATVDGLGRVTAIAPGEADITATYGPADQGLRASVSIFVPRPRFTMSPVSLDFGDQNVGTQSARPMTLTNTSDEPLTIRSVTTGGDFSATDDCVASSPLAANATCTITVTFTPAESGARPGGLSISNTFNSVPVTFWLTGRGVQ